MAQATLLKRIRTNILRLRRDAGLSADPLKFGSTSGPDLPLARRWADAIRRGCVLFYDRDEVHVGLRGIDWSGAHRRHQEWPAQLNRFFWLPHLARVHAADGGDDLPRLARATIEDWMDQRGPYAAHRPMGAGDNTLNLSIRIGQLERWGWWNGIIGYADTGVFDDAFVARMLESTAGQLEFLRAHLAPVGNWRISHLNCLLFAGLALPGCRKHRAFAAAGLRETFLRQVEPDGAHCEHTPNYHLWMTELYTTLWRLGRAHRDLALGLDSGKLLRMWDYAVASMTPDGQTAGLHDSHRWKPDAKGRADWLARREAIRREAGLRGASVWQPRRAPSRFFPDAGQLFLRDGWTSEATFLLFDASRWGGAHGHLSRLAVSLYAGGRMLLYDPGICTYEMSDPFAAHGKSTPAHNTITVNDWSQNAANPDRPEVHLLERFALATATYAGGWFPGKYTWRWAQGLGLGHGGAHTRTLLWIKGRYAVVLDQVEVGAADVPFAAHWQFPAGPHGVDATGYRAWTCGAAANVLVQTLDGGTPLTLSVHEGRTEPLRGWLPTDVQGGRTPAPQLAFSGRSSGGPQTLVTLLVPFHGATVPEVAVAALPTERGAMGWELRWGDGAVDFLMLRPGLDLAIGTCGPVRTDGTLAFVACRRGRPRQALLHAGFNLNLGRRTLLAAARGGTYEWSAQA